MEAIILAGGFGRRLKKVIKDTPKPMAKIGDKPFLEIIINKLNNEGFNHVVLSLGYLAEQIKSYFGTNYNNLKISYSIEDYPLGTGGAIKKAISKIKNDYFYVFNGDSYLNLNIKNLDNFYHKFKKNIIVGKEVWDVERFGLIVSEEGVIKKFNEKKSSGHGIINTGCYLFKSNIIKQFPDLVNFSLENEAFPYLIKKENILLYLVNGEFIDIGTPEDYEKAQTLLKDL